MPFPAKFLIVVACALSCIAPAWAGDKRVWRIDSLIATQKGGNLLVAVKGAVATGGWKSARLHVVHTDGHALTVEFVAMAPPPGMNVIEGLVPVEARLAVKGHAASVRVMAEANEMTSQVLH
jgi:hypothetical protein